MSDDFILYGHRGGGDPFPDSTQQSYVWGMNWGADFVEPDVYLTKDGVLVVSHDNDAGGFANETYAQALAKNANLLTFGQVIDMVKQYSTDTGRDIGIIPELKDQSLAAAQALVATLVQHEFTDRDRVVVQSFGSQNLQWLHNDLMPAAGVDFQLAQLGTGIVNPAQIAAYADIVAPSVGSFSAADVAAAHAAGLKVVAWTITGAEADIQKLEALGVDGVFADNIQQARPGEEDLNGVHVIYGTPQWDAVSDTAGNDMVYAMQGDDIVRAGTGNDVVYGDAGNDVLFGGAGNDHLVGGSGTDFLAGGAGTNVLDGSAGNDVIVASGTGDQVLFRSGNGIDLVSLNSSSGISFSDINSTDVTITKDGSYLIIRSGSDALVIRDSGDTAHLPASVTFADGVTWTGAELASHATVGSDTAVDAALPGLEYVLNKAPALAAASTIAAGTDLVAGDGIGNSHLAEHVANVETGAIYRLSFSLSDLGGANDAGVKVLWNGQVLYQGTPDHAGTAMHFEVTGGSGDGSSQLVFEGAGSDPSVFDASLTGVHFVKLTDPGVPVATNAAPVATDSAIVVSQDIAISGKVTATDSDGDPLAYSLGDAPRHGTLNFSNDGSYTYTPQTGYTGADTFTYIVNDGHGGVAEASMGIDVKSGVAIGTDLIVNGSFEDVSVSTGNNGSGDWGYRNTNGVIAGWTDVNHNRVEQHWDSPNGVVAKDGQMWIDMDGYDTNTHLVQTLAHVETGASYRLSFSVADADTAVSDDGIKVMFGGKVIYEGLGSNPWQTFDFTVVGGSGDGSNKLEFIATGTNLNTYGAALDAVHFVKTANAGGSLPDNHAPDAADGSIEGVQDTKISGHLSATDVDGDAPLVFNLGASGPAHGDVVVNADGTFSYTPDQGYTGSDTFSFTVNDGHGGTDTATETLTISAKPPADTPLIANGSFENANPTSGWTDTNGTAIEIHGTKASDTTNNKIDPADGSHYVDLNSGGTNAAIAQTVTGAEDGKTYQLSFSVADTNPASNDAISVTWGGEVIWTGTPPNIVNTSANSTKPVWQTITVDVVGGAGNGSNQLVIHGAQTSADAASGLGAAIDNVSMIKIDANPNLIVNGSFEDLTGANDPGTWGFRNDKGSAPGTLPGWTDLSTFHKIEQHGPHSIDKTNNPVDAHDGNYYVDMVGSSAGNNSKLSQTVSGVEAGKTYELTFSLADGDSAHSDNGVNVTWGGKLVYSTSPGFDPATGTIATGSAVGQPTPATGETWQTITVHVVGGAGDGSNKLEFDGTGNTAGNNGAELDHVSLRRVNNAPVVDHAPALEVHEGAASASLDLLEGVSDPDGDTLTATGLGTLPAGISYDAGTHRLTVDPSDDAYQHLAAGETQKITVSYTVSDGASEVETSASFTVVGVNDAPVVEATGATVAENQAGATVATFDITDPDSSAFTFRVIDASGMVDDRFEVVLDTANHYSVELKAGVSLDYEAAATITRSIEVTDDAGENAKTTAAEFVIHVTDVNENPGNGGDGNNGGSGDNGGNGGGSGNPGQPSGGQGPQTPIEGTAGNDKLVSSAGDDTINAGAGKDTVVYSGDHTAYTIAVGSDGLPSSVSGPDGHDTLSGVEYLSFKDGVLVFDTDKNTDMLFRLYDTAFNRAPDQAGITANHLLLETGNVDMHAMAAAYADSAEFKATYGAATTNEQFVQQLYHNVFDRAADDAGLKFWTENMANGHFSRGEVLIGFSESAEEVGLTGPALAKGVFFDASFLA